MATSTKQHIPCVTTITGQRGENHGSPTDPFVALEGSIPVDLPVCALLP